VAAAAALCLPFAKLRIAGIDRVDAKPEDAITVICMLVIAGQRLFEVRVWPALQYEAVAPSSEARLAVASQQLVE
jgi:hypothetical protein